MSTQEQASTTKGVALEIATSRNGSVLELTVRGKINSVSAPRFKEALSDLESVTRVVIDFKDVVFISSAGLRAILATEKIMRAQGGEIVITNAHDEVLETFEITQLTKLLIFE